MSNVKEYVNWVFTHPKIKESIQNFQYVCSIYMDDYMVSDNENYNKAMVSLQQIYEIDNPSVCRGMFESAIINFPKL